MPTFIAVEFKEQSAFLVRIETKHHARFTVADALVIPLSDDTQIDSNDETEKNSNDNFELFYSNSIQHISTTVDAILAIIPEHRALFKLMDLPFSDQKTIQQVLPLQLQDSLPFDVDDYVVDAISTTNKQENGQFRLLTSLVPESDVVSCLSLCKRFKLDPKLITTNTACLLGIREIFPSQLVGSYIIVNMSYDLCSIATFVDDKLEFIRALHKNADNQNLNNQLNKISQEIACAIAKTFHETQKSVAKCYTLGLPKEALHFISQEININITPLDTHEVIEIGQGVNIQHEDVLWAIGLLGEEIRQNKKHRRSINFRQGIYAYRPLLQNIAGALRNEVFYLLLILLIGITWCALSFITTYNIQSEIERSIAAELKLTIPLEVIASGAEVSSVEQKTQEIEEELRMMGSLSSISFLEILKGLTTALPESIDIKVDSIQMSKERLEIKGSVKDYKTLGKLNGTLEAQSSLFCKVTVDTKSQQFGTNRVQFSADVQLCE